MPSSWRAPWNGSRSPRKPTPIPAPYEQKYGICIDTPNPAFGIYRLRPCVAHAWLNHFPGIATRWNSKNFFRGNVDSMARPGVMKMSVAHIFTAGGTER